MKTVCAGRWGDIPIRKHLQRLLTGKLDVLFYIALQRRTDIYQLGANQTPFWYTFPECGQVLPNGLPEYVIIRGIWMVGVPVYLSIIAPQVRYDSTTEVWIAGNDPFSPYILKAHQCSVHYALCAVEHREADGVIFGSNMSREEFSPRTQILPQFAY